MCFSILSLRGFAPIGLRGAWFVMVLLHFSNFASLCFCECCVRLCHGVLRVSTFACRHIPCAMFICVCLSVCHTMILSFFGCAVVRGHSFSVVFLFAVVAVIVVIALLLCLCVAFLGCVAVW